MKKILLIASALFVSGAAMAQNPAMKTDRNYVEINSAADTLVAPNKFRISITLSEAPSKGKITLTEQEKSLATALKTSGVDIKKQLVITGQSNTDGKRKDVYQYKSYLLTLTEPTLVETVFNELQANDIANVRLTQSTRSDLKELQAAVRVKAMKNAQLTATELAGALGQKIGKAIMIQSYSSAPENLYRSYAAMKTGNALQADGAAMPDLNFNDVRVDQNVTVRFVLD